MRSGGIVPRTLSFGSKWRLVDSFTPLTASLSRSCCSRLREAGYTTKTLHAVAERKIPAPAETRNPTVQPLHQSL